MVVGLSGGVDSSVAAAILLEQEYEVEAVYLECYNEPGCRTDQDKKDALRVAVQLGIRFQTLDFRREYRDRVIEYFYREYEAGRTPNPDIVCNREIKFGIFYDWAMNHGYDYVATGHYARIMKLQGSVLCKEIRGTKDGSLYLLRAKDESKDQSYFLWQIPRNHLKHILFPLGNMLKSEVRTKANELELHTASKPDSMGICFIGEVDVNELLKKRLGEKEGVVVMEGEVVGKHRGLWFYTIGSRWEMSINSPISNSQILKLGITTNNMPPLYVIGKDTVKNQLIVGGREEGMTSHFEINSQIINSQILKLRKKLWVRIRNLGELIEVESVKDGQVILKEKIFGVASGQSSVFYDQNGVLVTGAIIV